MIQDVSPEIDCGRYPIKRVPGEAIRVVSTIFTDGHDVVAAALLHRREGDRDWIETPMTAVGNDRYAAEFTAGDLGCEVYTVRAWVDRFETWHRDLLKRVEAQQDISVDLLIGGDLIDEAARRAGGPDREALERWSERLLSAAEGGARTLPDHELSLLMSRHEEGRFPVEFARELSATIDNPRARFGTWYELFPRSATNERRHGTFADVEARLPYIAGMGFDVLYLPPIHPIGHTNRKGKNNTTEPEAGAPGSPWAIGNEDGGHTAVHPDLGTLDDFDNLIAHAREYGIEVAMDVAFQCSPDHPYVKEHPEWFRKRPDGSIQYAENPPKKYQDIYPIDFETDAWRELWDELRDVVMFWAGRGVRIFRVDNPHTKSLRFWEWMIADVRRRYPDAVFLSEAFTRPAVMYHLAKIGFDQSYTYFTWRVTKRELVEYFTELTQTEVREYFRPNLWPNTPDILPEHLQIGGRPGFMQRLILAATLGTSYGIYGPAFELLEQEPLLLGKEEYLDSEKY
ncbi:MAG: alpha-1,4-glucan--maltose-1-phosphate maltosyltransferase, partial [Actinomycetota bacterium]